MFYMGGAPDLKFIKSYDVTLIHAANTLQQNTPNRTQLKNGRIGFFPDCMQRILDSGYTLLVYDEF